MSQQHTVHSYSEELSAVAANLSHMGGLAEAQLADCIEAIVKRDLKLAERTVEHDKLIDDMETEIEHQALRLLALRQPVALDLRETVAAIKISSDLERIGDLAKNIAKRAQILALEEPLRVAQGFQRMGNQCLKQLKEVLDAYGTRNSQKALAVWRRDEDLDQMYNSLFRELLTYMMEDPRTISACTHYLFVAKNIERIGDHATNIAETIYFLVNGTLLAAVRPKGDSTSTTTVDFDSGIANGPNR
jgi:phosphate transport system protein